MSTPAMSVPPLRLEEAILRAVGRVRDGGWLQCSYANLINRISDVDAPVANENMNLIIGGLVSLGIQGHLNLAKIEDGQRSMFDFERRGDDKYLTRFFAFNTFDL